MSNTKTASKKMQNDKVLIVKPKPVNFKEQTQKATEKEQQKAKDVKASVVAMMPSAEDRIKNAENFSILTSKFAHLKTKNEELKKFKISSDGSKERLTLKNSTGFELAVSNSQVLNKVLDLLQGELNTLLTKAEAEVQNFVI